MTAPMDTGCTLLLFSCSVVPAPCSPMDAAYQASLSFTISWSLLKFISIELVVPFNHLTFCHPPLHLLSIFPSIRVFPMSWLRLMSIVSMMPSNHLILYCPLLLVPSSFPASGSLPVSQLFPSGGPSTGVLASATVLLMNIQG